MKTIILNIVIIFLITSPIFGQNLIIKLNIDTTEYAGDTVSITIPNHRGSVQWEKSLNLSTWENVPNANADTLKIFINSYSYYRASIVEGTCKPIYSDTSLIIKSGFKSLPTITTTVVTSITTSSGVSGGNIINDGGALIITKGVCWSTNVNPTILDSKTSDGTAIGAFISNISGLLSNTIYYVRAYATNSVGTAYGSQVQFTTSVQSAILPTLTTNAPSSITDHSVIVGGNISNDGGASVTARGICISLSPNTTPTLSDFVLVIGTGTGSFSNSVGALKLFTTYYVRAYATNSVGTAYGNSQVFTTSAKAIDFENNQYSTTLINGKYWTNENLVSTKYSDGTNIVGVYDTKDDLGNIKTSLYGKLYTWVATMHGSTSSNNNPSNVQGVCPTGWHLPSQLEFQGLVDYLGGATLAGGKLKGTYWQSPNTGWDGDAYKFSSMGAGDRLSDGTYYGYYQYTWFWSSTELTSTTAYRLSMSYNSATTVLNGTADKTTGFSIRCVRD